MAHSTVRELQLALLSMIHVVLEYVKSNSKYITVVVVILKLVFISLISYIVCSLQTFLIAPFILLLSDWKYVGLMTRRWQEDDDMITTWSLSQSLTAQQHVSSTISLKAAHCTAETKLFIIPPRFTFLSWKLNSFGQKNLGAEAICWLHILIQEIKKNIPINYEFLQEKKNILKILLMSIENQNYTSVHLIKWMKELAQLPFWAGVEKHFIINYNVRTPHQSEWGTNLDQSRLFQSDENLNAPNITGLDLQRFIINVVFVMRREGRWWLLVDDKLWLFELWMFVMYQRSYRPGNHRSDVHIYYLS